MPSYFTIFPPKNPFSKYAVLNERLKKIREAPHVPETVSCTSDFTKSKLLQGVKMGKTSEFNWLRFEAGRKEKKRVEKIRICQPKMENIDGNRRKSVYDTSFTHI